MKKITIYDIALKTGFSASTVSRVLSGSDYQVNKNTESIIKKAAIEMNYSNNFLSRNFNVKESNEIGVIIPNISNYYYTTLLQGIQYITTNNNCNILLCDSLRNPKNEIKNALQLIEKKVKGVLVASVDPHGESIQKISESGIPVIAMEQKINTQCITTMFNFYRGAEIAVNHLAEKGHKKIAFISPPIVRSSRKELFEGYKKALQAHGLHYNQKYIYIANEEPIEMQNNDTLLEFDIGKEAIKKLIQTCDPPTAYFCVNDLIAISALRELQKNNIKVPSQSAVVGFDNIIFSSVTSPALTTVDQSAFNLGRTAATLLFNKISDPTLNENISALIEPSLVIREST